ncbi:MULTISPECIES: hypothetical protein [Pseudomonas]|nr:MULTISPECIES: hypothetical protein [Pseudomonas]
MKKMDASAVRDIVSGGVLELKKKVISSRGVNFYWCKGNPIYLSVDE